MNATSLTRRLPIALALLGAVVLGGVPRAFGDPPPSVDTPTASSAGWQKDVSDLDRLLSRAGPDDATVAVGDMIFRVDRLRAYRERLLATHVPALAPDQTPYVPRGLNTATQPTPESAFPGNVQTWDGGNVPYVLDSSVTSDDAAAFVTATQQWQAVARVHFYPQTTESDYIVLHSSDVNDSLIGRQGGAQTVNIYNWNYEFKITHELGHALGMIHEQSRSDRDTYVTINTANIQNGEGNNFDIVPGSLNNGPYDFDSDLHYGRASFSSNGQDTITVLGDNNAYWQSRIGQRDHLSQLDGWGMINVYGPSYEVYTDASFTGVQKGSGINPFVTVGQSLGAASTDAPASVFIKGGDYNEQLTISQPVTLVNNGGGNVSIGS